MTTKFVLAFDFGGTKMAIATATEDREIIAREEIGTQACGDGPNALRIAIMAGQKLVDTTVQSTGGQLAGVGVSTMGITLPDRVEMAPNVAGWEFLRIGESMQAAFAGVPIHIDNDVKAAALAEVRRGALRGKDFGMYVNMGTGLAIAYTLGDRVLQGHNGASGEIAYFQLSKDGRYGYRDGVAPLEEYAGGRAIGQRASGYFGESMTTKDLYARVPTDPAARRFLEDTLEEISFHLSNLIIAWDPQIVVFGGGIVSGSDIFLPYLRERIEQFVPYPPELVLAHYQAGAGLYGAVELAL